MPDDISMINLNDLTHLDLTNMSALEKTQIHGEVVRKYSIMYANKPGKVLNLDETNLLDAGDLEGEFDKIKQIL